MQDISFPKKKYNIIYADPPWQYKTSATSTLDGLAQSHYPTMCASDIRALPVNEIAAENSILFLWATYPKLKEALTVVNAWGFEYKTVAFTWIKLNKNNKDPFLGLGFWTRSNAEICLLGIRGFFTRKDAGVKQLIFSPIEEHSKKPDEARQRIVQLCGDLPRIELFARQAVDGWDCWGNEV